MAKGNAFLGQLRGKIGDVVFTRTGGAQTSRALNRHPRNPQTPAQMYQRGCLATVSEMYIRGTRNFFKYAFMNKTAAQSEFNKFCQLNIGRVPCNGKAALSQGAPAIGNFIMTQGTLAPIRIDKRDDSFTITMRNDISSKPVAQWTMGDVSRAFIETYGYQQGDIITYLDISSSATPFTTLGDMIANESLTSIAGMPLWNIKQFRLDTTSEELMTDSGIFTTGSSDNVLQLSCTYEMGYSAVEGITMVCSRNVKSGVLVSSSEMLVNTATQAAINLGLSDEWKEAVARYWIPDSASSIAPVNILQGSLSVPQHVSPVPEVNHVVSVTPALPTTTNVGSVKVDFTLSDAADPEVEELVGKVKYDGEYWNLRVSEGGSSIGLEAGAVTLNMARRSDTLSFRNPSGVNIQEIVISKNLNE